MLNDKNIVSLISKRIKVQVIKDQNNVLEQIYEGYVSYKGLLQENMEFYFKLDVCKPYLRDLMLNANNIFNFISKRIKVQIIKDQKNVEECSRIDT